MSTTFADLGVPAPLAARLDDRGIDAPFPIQAATIPDALEGRDVCGKAPTGSGKTIAFGIPMVALLTRAAPKRPKGLVLCPTRELALQVADELSLLGDLRVLAVYGGAGIEPQLKKLRAGVDIVVACPGRLLDVIDRGACDLRDVKIAVLDEADRMADMGFLPDVRRILDQTNAKRQTLLFSATLDGAVDTVVRDYQRNPVVHELEEEEGGDVVHHHWVSERPGRVQLAAEIVERVGPTVVFCRTRHGADRVARQLGALGVSAAAIHGSRSQAQRERSLSQFHRGEVKALVATDVAARGIHVEGVACVLHFDLPADPKDYVHRSGRTGRAGNTGTVVALLPMAQKSDAAKLRRQVGLDDVVLREPIVELLAEGHAAFSAEAHRVRRGKDRPKDGGAKAKVRAKGIADAGRAGRSKPTKAKAAKSEWSEWEPTPKPKRAAHPERAERPERAAKPERTGKPAHGAKSERWERADRPAKGSPRADRPGRPERAVKPERGPKPERGSRPDGGERSEPTPFDRAVAGSDKVRPSGASRRKARRERMAAAGEELPRAKKRRSGAPRPAPADGPRSRRSAAR